MPNHLKRKVESWAEEFSWIDKLLRPITYVMWVLMLILGWSLNNTWSEANKQIRENTKINYRQDIELTELKQTTGLLRDLVDDNRRSKQLLQDQIILVRELTVWVQMNKNNIAKTDACNEKMRVSLQQFKVQYYKDREKLLN